MNEYQADLLDTIRNSLSLSLLTGSPRSRLGRAMASEGLWTLLGQPV